MRAAAFVALAAITLAGCSALSGRDESQHGTPGARAASSSAANTADEAHFTGSVAAQVISAARNDFETIYTYDYRDLPKYLRAGLAVTTAPYAARYRKLFEGTAARQLRAAKQAQVPAADLVGLADLARDGTAARVIVHATVNTSSAATSTPTTTATTVVLHLKLVAHRWRISDVTKGSAAQGSVPADAGLQRAVAAARTGVTRMFALRRAHFAADFAAALRGTTGGLHDTLSQLESALQKKLQDGQYDLSATITGFAVARADGSSAEFVVAIDEYRTGRQGARFGPYPLAFDVTLTGSGGTWLLRQSTQLT
jgi:hypothetical protein